LAQFLLFVLSILLHRSPTFNSHDGLRLRCRS
jgi:hypothetical protein